MLSRSQIIWIVLSLLILLAGWLKAREEQRLTVDQRAWQSEVAWRVNGRTQAPPLRPVHWPRQFGLRGLFALTTVMAVFFAMGTYGLVMLAVLLVCAALLAVVALLRGADPVVQGAAASGAADSTQNRS